MDLKQTKEILTAALRKAQERGVFTFEDVSVILPALNFLAGIQEEPAPELGAEVLN